MMSLKKCCTVLNTIFFNFISGSLVFDTEESYSHHFYDIPDKEHVSEILTLQLMIQDQGILLLKRIFKTLYYICLDFMITRKLLFSNLTTYGIILILYLYSHGPDG